MSDIREQLWAKYHALHKELEKNSELEAQARIFLEQQEQKRKTLERICATLRRKDLVPSPF